MSRIATLNNRYDRLLELNQTHHYTFDKNPKCDKYLSLLLKIKAEKIQIWNENRKNNSKYSENLNNGLKAVISLTRNDLFNLTSPIL